MKRCPICGSTPEYFELRYSYWYSCPICRNAGKPHSWIDTGDNKEDAMKMWNKFCDAVKMVKEVKG